MERLGRESLPASRGAPPTSRAPSHQRGPEFSSGFCCVVWFCPFADFLYFAAHAGRVGGQRGAKLTHRKEEKTQTAENRGEDYRASDDTESLSSLLISQVTMKKRNLGGRKDRTTTELRPSEAMSLGFSVWGEIRYAWCGKVARIPQRSYF